MCSDRNGRRRQRRERPVYLLLQSYLARSFIFLHEYSKIRGCSTETTVDIIRIMPPPERNHTYQPRVEQGCTYPECQVAIATKFCMVAPNIWGSLVWNLLHVTILARRISRRLLHIWEICAILEQRVTLLSIHSHLRNRPAWWSDERTSAHFRRRADAEYFKTLRQIKK